MNAEVRRIHNERDRGFSAAVVVPLGPGRWYSSRAK